MSVQISPVSSRSGLEKGGGLRTTHEAIYRQHEVFEPHARVRIRHPCGHRSPGGSCGHPASTRVVQPSAWPMAEPHRARQSTRARRVKARRGRELSELEDILAR